MATRASSASLAYRMPLHSSWNGVAIPIAQAAIEYPGCRGRANIYRTTSKEALWACPTNCRKAWLIQSTMASVKPG